MEMEQARLKFCGSDLPAPGHRGERGRRSGRQRHLAAAPGNRRPAARRGTRSARRTQETLAALDPGAGADRAERGMTHGPGFDDRRPASARNHCRLRASKVGALAPTTSGHEPRSEFLRAMREDS